MVYYNDASSSNLKPVLLVVSVITAIIFGAGYFAYSNSLHVSDQSVTAPAAIPAAAPVATHSHV